MDQDICFTDYPAYHRLTFANNVLRNDLSDILILSITVDLHTVNLIAPQSALPSSNFLQPLVRIGPALHNQTSKNSRFYLFSVKIKVGKVFFINLRNVIDIISLLYNPVTFTM